MALSSGTRLGPYEIVAAIGAGGMGEVYRARDTRLDRSVAVKVLPCHLSESIEARQRFEREARSISSLTHPNICHLYDVGSQDGNEYLVMEYLEGETLAERLRKGPLPLEQVLVTGSEVARALETAHERGILHRDLKPSNIMLTRAGAKLMDFGLAKTAAMASSISAAARPATPSSPTLTIASLSTPAETLTQEGAVLGTLQYIAPEVLQGKDADARSDIFSFGCVLYEMITGQRAFPGKSQLTVLSAIVDKDPEPILTLWPDTPPALEYVVRTCLAKNPAERWQNAGDIARNFQVVRSATPQRQARTDLHARLAYVLAAASLLIAILALWWLAWKKPGPVASAGVSRFSFRTATNGSLIAFALSPDGQQIAFADAGAIWVRRLDSQIPRKLSGTVGEGFNERLMFWSYDGRSVAYLSGFKLRRVSVADGIVQDICELRGLSPAGGSWGRNDVILIGGYRAPIMKIAASGGRPVAMKLEKDENGQRWPSFLPDGQHFLYLSASGSFLPAPDNRQIRYADLDGNNRVVLRQNSNAEYAAGNLLYVKDGALVAAPFNTASGEITGASVVLEADVDFRTTFGRGYFDARPSVLAYSVAQPELLAWVDRDGREATRVGREGPLTSFDVSPDGKSAVVEITNERNGNGELWIMDLQRGVPTRVTMDDTGWNWAPIWSADGKRIYFSSTRSSVSDLYERQVASSEDRSILTGADRFAPLDISRDGKYLLYEDLDPSSAADLWVLPLSGDKPFAYIKTNYMESSARFSPDARWVAYVSNESGASEVYVQSFPTLGQEIRVSSEGGMDPRWRRDGHELYFVSADGQLMAAEVKTDGSLSVAIPKPIFRFSGNAQLTRRSYWPAPDGHRFLVMQASDDSGAQINVTVNWTAALNK
jgi:eukaryotic-like serine/threonine-protein kinase